MTISLDVAFSAKDSLFVAGEWVEPSGSERIEVVSPNTEEVIASVPAATEKEIDAAVAAARRVFDATDGWPNWSAEERREAIGRLADALDSRSAEFARAVSAQNGLPIAVSSNLEGALPSVLLRYYADIAAGEPVEETRAGLFGRSAIVRKEPIGVVGAIGPFNVPQSLAFMKIAPAIAAGNPIVLKPSPETVLDSFLLAEAVEEADLPKGLISVVPGGGEIGGKLVEHSGVDKVAFTGSTATGRRVAEACGRLLRPATLELGGKSAGIFLPDADLDLEKIGYDLYLATLVVNGMCCYASTRILAPRSRYDDVVDFFAEFARSLTVGHSLDPDTQIGPVVSQRQRDKVEYYIQKGIDEGARLVTGGGRPKGQERGWFIEPTIFADVDNRMAIAREEIFGPVLSIIGYDDEEDAIRITNDSEYGLGGSVWTADPDHGIEIARRLRTGSVGINNSLPDPVGPIGGYKDSGIGREYGPEALDHYKQIKSIYL